MVELSLSPPVLGLRARQGLERLDAIFGSLADPIRRDILRRVAKKEMSISDVAEPYSVTFAAISKHLKVLEKAKLIIKRKQGREQVVQLAPEAIKDAAKYLKTYEKIWNNRLDNLETYLSTFPPTHHG
jgi:DNA-binding transcriptional ArsR family regulator